MSCSVHDMIDLEGRGIPAVCVATTEFVDAAAAQGRALGAEPACVFVPHPIQDRTDAEMRTIADDAVNAMLRALTTPGG